MNEIILSPLISAVQDKLITFVNVLRASFRFFFLYKREQYNEVFFKTLLTYLAIISLNYQNKLSRGSWGGCPAWFSGGQIQGTTQRIFALLHFKQNNTLMK